MGSRCCPVPFCHRDLRAGPAGTRQGQPGVPGFLGVPVTQGGVPAARGCVSNNQKINKSPPVACCSPESIPFLVQIQISTVGPSVCGCPAASGAYRPLVHTSRWGHPCRGAPQGPVGAPPSSSLPFWCQWQGNDRGAGGRSGLIRRCCVAKRAFTTTQKWGFWLYSSPQPPPPPAVPCTGLGFPGCCSSARAKCSRHGAVSQGRSLLREARGSCGPQLQGGPRLSLCLHAPPHQRGSGANTKQRRLPLQSLVSEPQQDLAEPPLPHPFPREMLLKRRNAGTKELTRHTPLPLPAWGNCCWLFPEPPPPEARVSPGCWR